jgi:hypothetical protein
MKLLAALVVGQFLAFLALTLAGWGAVPNGGAAPPPMERIGAPPALIPAYADLNHITLPLEDGAGHVLATAAFAGTASVWGGPGPRAPSFNPFGESPLATFSKLGAEIWNTLLFVLPAGAQPHGPLYVAVKGGRHRLEVAATVPSLGFAIAATSVENHVLADLGASLPWRVKRDSGPTRAPLLLLREAPDLQAYVLATRTVVSGHGEWVAATVAGAAVGTPVVELGPSSALVAGFVEEPGRDSTAFVPAAAVARALRAAAPSIPDGE